jgi:hypothetical protein
MSKTTLVTIGSYYSGRTTTAKAAIFVTNTGFVGATLTKRQIKSIKRRLALIDGDGIKVLSADGFADFVEMQSGDWIGQQVAS